MKSEFGRGYVTCLRQFLNHWNRLDEEVTRYASLTPDPDYPDMFSEASAVCFWAAGASDHLRDLVRPVRWVTKADWIEAKAIRDRMIDLYFERQPTATATATEAKSLLERAHQLCESFGNRAGAYPGDLENALLLDKAAGLAPQAGEWSCPENLRRIA